ncbi:NUDIX domain-containing protein [Modicisalibacter xianhensis]|uniref:NUDIX domain-containing protein n=1 Tax=Modicisalibacter xianhensis TaxID=442341 RepID=A0A4R8FJ52_9GAMM|nr:CoA pyrophosphatase [Halomonas xianhensis]TDX25332.1 NUDIX domain-containing protein [Halomonas xianhensis]
MLEKLHERLQAHRPRKLSPALRQAAVLIPIVEHDEPTLLFTRRAAHLKQHGGQVAFPGGKRDPEDPDLLTTALREAQEEIALSPRRVHLLGQLGDVISLHGLRVTPFVGLIPPGLALRPEPGELDTIFEVPLSVFLEDRRSHTDVIVAGERTLYVPSYEAQGHVIWGLSAMMLVELLAVGFDKSISLDHAPPGSPLNYRPERRRAVPDIDTDT